MEATVDPNQKAVHSANLYVWTLVSSILPNLTTACILKITSAPVFSTIGFIVRLRISGNPDTTWNQPEILLWG